MAGVRRNRAKNQLQREPIKIWADHQRNWPALIAPLRGQYVVESTERLAIHGDAPKCFLRVKEHSGAKVMADVRNWTKFIAKVGSKFYPVESITEHLITRVGQLLGINVADSRLRLVKGQVRFLSRYFLSRQESLVHGIEIFRLQVGKEFVAAVARARMEQEIYSFQTVFHSIKDAFPAEANPLLADFVKMLAFDALIGNNDRHPANWGIITSLIQVHPARFAPIFDTARGLFWNFPEAKLSRCRQDNDMFDGYCRRSKLLIGWDGAKSLNHVDLLSAIVTNFPQLRPAVQGIADSFSSETTRNVAGGSQMMAALTKLWNTIVFRRNPAEPCRRATMSSARFDLKFGRMVVGLLTFDAGSWKFGYSNDFKNQKKLRPLVQFPDLDKVYESDELWPIFGMRIPSLRQPSVKAIVDREQIDTSDFVELLRRFGRRTAANPFELVEETRSETANE